MAQKKSEDKTMILGGQSTYEFQDSLPDPNVMVGWFLPVAAPYKSIKILGDENVIGRSEDAEINLTELLPEECKEFVPTVSRQHAHLYKDKEGQVTIVDLRSANKTFVNQEKLIPYERFELEDNALISFGKLELLFKKFKG